MRERFRDSFDDAPEYMSGIAHLQAVQVMASAQKTAERFVGEAQEYCRELAENARQRRDQMLAEARLNAARMMEQADSEARSAVAEAAARTTADVEHGNLQGEITYLRTFSEVYRTHLRAYLEALLRNLDEWGRAERSAMGTDHDRPQRLSPGRAGRGWPAVVRRVPSAPYFTERSRIC
jgi:cell division septum initiation protein DivIVA